MFTYDGKNYKASPLALLFYRQAFNAPIIQDWDTWAEDKDTLKLYQILWALEKTALEGQQRAAFPDFETWIETLEPLPLTDAGFTVPLGEEVARGFLGQKPEILEAADILGAKAGGESDSAGSATPVDGKKVPPRPRRA
jgi:hypothetical protein